MSTIVTRTGKGSPLTFAEMDANLTALNTDKIEAASIHAATSKTTLVDADELTGVDSATGFSLIKVTFANLKASLKTYLDTLYSKVGSITSSGLTMNTSKFLGRTTASNGAIEELSASQSLTLLGLGTPNAANGVVVLDASSKLPAVDGSQLTGISSGLTGFRNRIINGDMRIDQRNAGASVTPTGITYFIDRWILDISQASKLTLQRVADAPTGAKYSMKVTVASQFSPGAADYFVIGQKIEGQNIIDFQFGTAGALTITISAQVKCSVTGTFSCALRNSAANRSYIATYTISQANVWTPLVLTVAGDQSGTWLTDTSTGLEVDFDLGSGTNWNTTAGAWQAGSYLRTSGSVTFVNQTAGATWQLAQIQVESGSTATAFEQRPIGLELALCQRYYCKSFPQSTAPAQNSANGAVLIPSTKAGTAQIFSNHIYFPMTMRAAPNITLYNPSAANAQVRDLSAAGDCSATTVYNVNESNFGLYCTGNAGTIVGSALVINYAAEKEL